MKFSSNHDETNDVAELERLVKVLEAEERGYAELETLEQGKKEDLVAGNIESFEAQLRRQESIVPGLRRLEAERQEIMQGWHRDYGERPTPTLGEIIDRCPQQQSEQIAALKEVLTQRVTSMGKIVRSNEILVKQSLEHVNRMVSIITGTHESLAYEIGGRRSDLGRRQVLDRSV